MPQVTGTKLGPYELLSSLGVGGMGEVYRARDTRLGRHVAVKILPASFSSDAYRLHRFEKEARAAASLNHPNILAVFDIGQQEGSPYIVSELLEGETLRDKMQAGAIPLRKVIDYATQLASGLAAAHDRGILHRDLKPENIFITRDNRVKILDFGLAKLMHVDPEAKEDEMTRTLQSDAGTILGTVGYMSPEQVRGRVADARSDIFSFGAILYEMLSGRRAFHGESPAETMTAIIHDEPQDLRELKPAIPTALERVVYHCLEKKPEDRFQSARDVAFDLETISSVSGSSLAHTTTALRAIGRYSNKRRIAAIAIALFVVTALGLLFYWWKIGVGSTPAYRQLTFRRGTVFAARFAPDGQVVYSAEWEGSKPEMFTTGSGGRGSVSTGIHNAKIESISRTGEMLVLLVNLKSGEKAGTLARASSGSAPRAILEDVESADWSPDGNSIAAARYTGQRYRLEYPIGNQLYESESGWISDPRVSPDGESVAFFEHPYAGDDAGSVAVIDRHGNKRTLTHKFSSERGLAWAPSGKEIWFTASQTGIDLELYGVNLSGKLRPVLRVPGGLELLDIGSDGRILIMQGQRRRVVMFESNSPKTQRDLVIANWTVPAALTPDGSTVLLDEEAENSEGGYTAYLRKTDGSQPIRLGQGAAANDLSHDRKWALATNQQTPPQLLLLPTGAGDPRQITHDNITHRHACFLSDDLQVAFTGVAPGQKPRVYVQSIAGGPPRALSAEGEAGMISCAPKGNLIGISEEKISILSADGQLKRDVPNIRQGEYIAGWADDGKAIFTYLPHESPTNIYRVEMETGKRSMKKELTPPEAVGSDRIAPVFVTPDGNAYIYNIARFPNELYTVEGLK